MAWRRASPSRGAHDDVPRPLSGQATAKGVVCPSARLCLERRASPRPASISSVRAACSWRPPREAQGATGNRRETRSNLPPAAASIVQAAAAAAEAPWNRSSGWWRRQSTGRIYLALARVPAASRLAHKDHTTAGNISLWPKSGPPLRGVSLQNCAARAREFGEQMRSQSYGRRPALSRKRLWPRRRV